MSWHNERRRHALASKGIKTAVKDKDEILKRIIPQQSPTDKELLKIYKKVQSDLREYGYVIVSEKVPSTKFDNTYYDVRITNTPHRNPSREYTIQVTAPNGRVQEIKRRGEDNVLLTLANFREIEDKF